MEPFRNDCLKKKYRHCVSITNILKITHKQAKSKHLNVIVWWFLQKQLNTLARRSERICIDSEKEKKKI